MKRYVAIVLLGWTIFVIVVVTLPTLERQLENLWKVIFSWTSTKKLGTVSLIASSLTVLSKLLVIKSFFRIRDCSFEWPTALIVGTFIVGFSRLYLSWSLFYDTIGHDLLPYFFVVISQACAQSLVAISICEFDTCGKMIPTLLLAVFLILSLLNIMVFFVLPQQTMIVGALFYFIMYVIAIRCLWFLHPTNADLCSHSSVQKQVLVILTVTFIAPNMSQFLPRLICFIAAKLQFMSMNVEVFSIYLLCTTVTYLGAAVSLEWVRHNSVETLPMAVGAQTQEGGGSTLGRVNEDDLMLDDEILESVERMLTRQGETLSRETMESLGGKDSIEFKEREGSGVDDDDSTAVGLPPVRYAMRLPLQDRGWNDRL